MLLAGLCRMYGLTMAEVRQLELWELDTLTRMANRELAES